MEPSLALQHLDALNFSAKVQNQDPGLLTRTDDPSIVTLGAEHPAGVPLRELQEMVARLHVPNLDVRVVACADETPTDAVDVQTAHQVIVRPDLTNALARVGVPDPDRLVVTS